MQILMIYIIGAIIGFVVGVIFQAVNLFVSMAQYSILFSFTYASIGRFIPNVRASLIRMVPPPIPFPTMMIYGTGIIELVIAFTVFNAQLRSIASLLGTLLCILLFPANIYAYRQNIDFNNQPPTNIYLRFVVQILFILSFMMILFYA